MPLLTLVPPGEHGILPLSVFPLRQPGSSISSGGGMARIASLLRGAFCSASVTVAAWRRVLWRDYEDMPARRRHSPAILPKEDSGRTPSHLSLFGKSSLQYRASVAKGRHRSYRNNGEGNVTEPYIGEGRPHRCGCQRCAARCAARPAGRQLALSLEGINV